MTHVSICFQELREKKKKVQLLVKIETSMAFCFSFLLLLLLPLFDFLLLRRLLLLLHVILCGWLGLKHQLTNYLLLLLRLLRLLLRVFLLLLQSFCVFWTCIWLIRPYRLPISDVIAGSRWRSQNYYSDLHQNSKKGRGYTVKLIQYRELCFCCLGKQPNWNRFVNELPSDEGGELSHFLLRCVDVQIGENTMASQRNISFLKHWL